MSACLPISVASHVYVHGCAHAVHAACCACCKLCMLCCACCACCACWACPAMLCMLGMCQWLCACVCGGMCVLLVFCLCCVVFGALIRPLENEKSNQVIDQISRKETFNGPSTNQNDEVSNWDYFRHLLLPSSRFVQCKTKLNQGLLYTWYGSSARAKIIFSIHF